MRISPRPTTLSVADFRFAIDSQRLILGKLSKDKYFLFFKDKEVNMVFIMYLKSIIGPAPKLHDTGLLVKGEVFNVHLKNCNHFG